MLLCTYIFFIFVMVEVPVEGESCPKTVFRQQKSRTTGSGSFRFRNPVSGVNFLYF